MRIEGLSLKGIGVFDEVNISFPEVKKKNIAEVHIFTGPNGSGKTTLLHALASVFGPPDVWNKLSLNKLHKRFRVLNPSTPLETSQFSVHFEDTIQAIALGKDGKIQYNKNSKKLEDYCFLANMADTPSSSFDFAAFSYSGYRFIEGQKVNLISAFNENPLNQALEFIKTSSNKSGTYNLNQWIANSISKRSISKEKGNTQHADRYAKTLKILEEIIGEITGNSIQFELSLDPINLYVNTNDTLLDFDMLPDGIRSLIGWIGDLLMRLDGLIWENETPIFERRLLIFLDEIEVHLHPAWQRKVLPVIQKLFVNSQIFLSTHSPFVVNSVDNAWVHSLELQENKKALVKSPLPSKAGNSYANVLSEILLR